MLSDSELVQDVLRGNRQSYGLLYDRYARLVRSICFDSTGCLSMAQDLAQEVFMRAFADLGTLREADRFGYWLVGIARRVCRDWRRARARDRHRYTGTSPEVEEFTPLALDDSVGALRKAISELPQREGLAVQAFYLHEQSAAEAQDLLGLSSSGFYKLLERARRRLALFLKRAEEPTP